MTQLEFLPGSKPYREVLTSKIHKATVTQARLDYIGSITIDEDLMKLADLWEGQKVLVVSNTSGVRLETYTIRGEPGSGMICMNGACAHLIKEGEEVIIMGLAFSSRPYPDPQCILVDQKNRFLRYLGRELGTPLKVPEPLPMTP